MKNQRKLDVITMPNDYIMFTFNYLEDHDYILSYPKFFGKQGFNHAKLKIKFVLIWITLPHHPFEF